MTARVRRSVAGADLCGRVIAWSDFLETRFGVAYFGTSNPWHVEADLDAIVQDGFSWIVLPATEEQVRYDARGVADRVAQAQKRGLEVWLSPWGVASLFGGEGLSEVGAQPSVAAVRDVLERWLEVAVTAKPDVLFWDEPHARPGEEDRIDVLRAAQARVPSCIRQALYWNPHVCPRIDEEALVGCWSVGLDAYDGDVPAAVGRARSLPSSAAVPHLWLRGFRITAEGEADLVRGVGEAVAHGVPLVGIWGYRGAPAPSCLACERPELMWKNVVTAIQTARSCHRLPSATSVSQSDTSRHLTMPPAPLVFQTPAAPLLWPVAGPLEQSQRLRHDRLVDETEDEPAIITNGHPILPKEEPYRD